METRDIVATAASLFNETWELIEAPDRSGEQDLAMLTAAVASRWHWAKVGGPEELATGDWQIAHVLSLLGEGSLAMRFATRALAVAEAEGWSGWRLASMHEGMARACATAGDVSKRDRHIAASEAALATETDDEDRAVIAAQLATVPR